MDNSKIHISVLDVVSNNWHSAQMDLVRKLERARLKGSGLLMITDEVEKEKKKKKTKKGKKRKNESESESDSDFNPSDED